ncbi:hypothetical protein [Halonatronum saccharophilum]|uniref:hypothetical protein n=1 Tax=Halonatronum saccharophilum TaxID=150060 RepID=UPI0004852A20|nr:hypothetical protein [Halonatronum saccharophilum]
MNNNIEEKAWQILNRIENAKEDNLDEAIREAVEREEDLDEVNKEEQIRQLKAKVEEIRKEKKEKECQLREIKKIKELDDLKDISEINIDKYKVASQEDREKISKKISYLAQAIKENKYLAEDTLKTFDLYRERMIERCIKEKDLGDQINSLT